ncbi:phosphoethanolamine transferase [Helicobacter cynogastricus]|uniref:phosphoethanolamine transferase n=1 Tax=Helicobacter cynogastricus TaxID=329937 RepID=UPI001F16F5A8|nr:phosphoethanolamine transferase [Helicobacter cynogastricus]
MGKIVLDRRFFLMWLVPVVVAFFATEAHGFQETLWHVLKVAFYGFLVFYIYYLLLSLIKSPRLVRVAKNAMLCLDLGLTFVDLYASYYFQMAFTRSLVGTILATNLRESGEFFESMVLPHLGFIGFYWIACLLFLYMVRVQIPLQPKQNLKIFTGSFCIFWAHNIGVFYLQDRHSFLINPNIPTRVMPIVKEIYAMVSVLEQYQQSKAIYTNLKQPYPKDYLSVEKNSVPNVVLVIGESASRHFMEVYGYSVPNTPHLSKLKTEKNLYLFNNAISPFANTLPVFQVLLNYGNMESQNTPWWSQRNLGRIFEMAGYQTFWIDSQDDLGNHLGFSLVSYSFNKRYWSNGPTDVPNATLDEWVIGAFEQRAKSQLTSKNFMIFHLFGSHFTYTKRFPKSFTKFTPADIPYQNLHVQNEADKQIVADYVNSLYYNDQVLSDIFNLFKNKDAIIFYLSDHAEDVYQSAHYSGHKCSNYGVEIPFMIYVTDTFKQKHPDKLKRISEALNKPFMSDDLIHSLLPLVGIHTKDNLESKNLFSPQFDTHRKRVYCNSNVYKSH